MAQGTKALAPQEEGWVYESQFLQTLVLNTGGDLSTAKRSAIGVNATGPQILYKRMTRVTVDAAP